ncbi:unnamed protein product [Adineta ricciae]|uniref:EF-hand domain-containing protein n=1 Tax=Adineta ricciae TaxID=249248 RepID=A0A815RRB2_ADIRI|nr:unnamed protein product [Adineta ricciae]CAF1481365.1 unnamed protein product [Adineta ricciae]
MAHGFLWSKCCPQRTRTALKWTIPWGCQGCGPCRVDCCGCKKGCCPDRRKRDLPMSPDDVFRVMDQNQNGALDLDEYARYLTAPMNQYYKEIHFNATDLDHDGLIEKTEFINEWDQY